MTTKQKDDLAQRIADWMIAVKERRGWTAEQWAKKAETSPTNITRLLSGKSRHVPNANTLAKLAAAANEPPPLLEPIGAIRTRRVPLLDSGELLRVWSSKSLETLAIARVKLSDLYVAADTPESYVAVRVETDAMSAIGVNIGDTLVIDLLTPPAHGQMACWLLDDKVSVAIYAPPYLIPQSTNPLWKPKSLDGAMILGVVKQQIRSFA